MKKSLCALLLLILLPLGTAQATEFKLTGRTTWQLGQLMVNGMPFVIDDQTRFKDWLNEDDLGGTWVEMKGWWRMACAMCARSKPSTKMTRTRWIWRGRSKGADLGLHHLGQQSGAVRRALARAGVQV